METYCSQTCHTNLRVSVGTIFHLTTGDGVGWKVYWHKTMVCLEDWRPCFYLLYLRSIHHTPQTTTMNTIQVTKTKAGGLGLSGWSNKPPSGLQAEKCSGHVLYKKTHWVDPYSIISTQLFTQLFTQLTLFYSKNQLALYCTSWWKQQCGEFSSSFITPWVLTKPFNYDRALSPRFSSPPAILFMQQTEKLFCQTQVYGFFSPFVLLQICYTNTNQLQIGALQ